MEAEASQRASTLTDRFILNYLRVNEEATRGRLGRGAPDQRATACPEGAKPGNMTTSTGERDPSTTRIPTDFRSAPTPTTT